MSTVKADYLVNAAGTGAPTLTNGAVLPAGSASAPAISPTGDSNTGIFFPAADTVAVSTAGTEAMRIDSSGNVGIGTTTVSYKLTVQSSSTGLTGFNRDIVSRKGDQTNFYRTSIVSNDSGSAFGPFASFASGIYHEYGGGFGASGGLTFATNTANAGPITFATANTERVRIDTSGNLLFNSGYGSVATAYGCRAWVNFNGTGTVAINGSGNVSSITDRGTGLYTANFTTAMPDVNYSVSGACQRGTTNDDTVFRLSNSIGLTTGGVGIATGTGTSYVDQTIVTVAIFR